MTTHPIPRRVPRPVTFILALGIAIAGRLETKAAHAEASAPAIDPAQAAAAFREIRELSAADGGRLWGVEIYGPLLFVDPSTRAVAANQADAEQHLTKTGEIFTGILPPNVVIANTAVDWAGVRWTMLLWPLPEDRTNRLVLLAHECWHRMQSSLGLPMANQPSFHLDTLEGRYWMQMEWRALGAALGAAAPARRVHVADALLFRAHRRSLFKDAAEHERLLEMNEGLAEYAGVRATLPDDPEAARYAADQLGRFSRRNSFTRSFAYASGPAYGLLLDGASASWRLALKPADDLGELLRASLGLAASGHDAQEAEQRVAAYDDGTLRHAELAREAARVERIAAYKRSFVDGPVLVLPLLKPSSSFDPNQVFAFEGYGTVYGVLSVTDTWGTLEVEASALVSPDSQRLTLSAPRETSASSLAGEGWKLSLSKGWKVVPGARPGDITLTQEE